MKKITIFLLLFFILIIAIFTFRPLGNNNPLLEQCFYCLATLTAATSAFLTLRTYGQGARFPSLLCFTLGLFSWLIADSIFTYLEYVINNLPYPSIADYFFLIGYVLIFTGLIFEIHFSDISWKKMNKHVYLASGIFTLIMLGVFSYLTVFSAYSPEKSFAENAVTIGYTVGDLFLVIAGFFIIVIVWEYRGGQAAKVWISLFFGFFLTLVGDLFYAIDPDDLFKKIGLIYSLSQYAYILGYLFIAYAFLNLRTILQSFQKRILIKPVE